MSQPGNNYLHKGSKVLIEGRLNPDASSGGPRIWNRQDGTPAASFEVTANVVRFMDSKGDAPVDTAEGPGEIPSDEEDEIPF